MNIIVYGNNDDTSLDDIIFKTLARYGDVQFFSKDKLVCSSLKKSQPCKTQFLVYELEHLPDLINCNGIFLFKKSFKNLNENKFPKGFLPIVDEQNLSAIKLLEKTNQIVITCGTSTKNTLSFSSFSQTEAIVALQRYLQADNNTTIEPHEFTVKLSSTCEPNTLLIICTILLLAGIPSTNGYET